VWAGQFDDWASAAAEAGGGSNPFGLSSWLTRQGKLALEARRDPSLTLLSQRPTVLPFALAGLSRPSVLDFGGGSGWVFERATSGGLVFSKYTVAEVAAVIKAFGAGARPPLDFVPLDGTFGHYDVVYSNSSIQYAQSNELLVRAIAESEPNMVLIDELLWSPLDIDWFTVQVNSDVPTVVRFVSTQILAEQMHTLGYRLVHAGAICPIAHGYPFPDMASFGKDRRIRHRLSMLFQIA